MERMLRVNFLGTLYWTKALLPQMVERRQGWIVFVASVAGKLGVPEESAYAASKFAMVGFAEALSLEVEDAGVHVLTVCPGTVRTEFFDAEALAAHAAGFAADHDRARGPDRRDHPGARARQARDHGAVVPLVRLRDARDRAGVPAPQHATLDASARAPARRRPRA